MRLTRGFFRLLAGSCSLLSLSAPAFAQLLVATPLEAPQAVEHAELAYAIGDGEPVTWISLRARRAPLALVAALPAGAVATSALDAWLEALETTASPRVLLPRDASNCGPSFVEVGWPRSRGAAPDELRLDSAEEVTQALEAQGLALTAALPSASSYVLWSWPTLASLRTTRTLRVTGGAAPLSFLPGSSFPVLVSAVTRGPMTYAAEVAGGSLGVTFSTGDPPRSDYLARARAWLESRAEPVLETRSRGLLFDWSIQADLVSVSPLVRTYALRAAGELPELDAEACSTALGMLRANAEGGEPEACAGADDAALALLTAGSDLATLQRFVVSGASGVDPAALSAGGEPRAPALRAALLDDTACKDTEPAPIVVETPRAGGSIGSGEPRGGGAVVEVEETVVVEHHEHTEIDCSSGPEPEQDTYAYDSCASDSSSSSYDSSEDCSSDTSSSSPSSDDSCDGGPGTDDDTGYDGDTCTGSAAEARSRQALGTGPNGTPRLQRPQRLKTSLWSLALAAVALPIRRRKRAT